MSQRNNINDDNGNKMSSPISPTTAAASPRTRCASAGGKDDNDKSELSARYWAYLFENLERSITEIYNTCEKQENVLQCKEVLIILENYTHDFGNLIEWLELKWKYEHTPQPQRPHALAWEIRKPSFSALPHTRAYEKLVGINSSPKTAAAPKSKSPCNSPLIPSENNNQNQSSLSKLGAHDHTESAGSNKASQEITASEEELSKGSVVETCEIGLQTDLEEDPDIFYFAGGRIVASQTDYNDEYGPLEPFDSSLPVVLVPMDISETDESPRSAALQDGTSMSNVNEGVSTTSPRIVVPSEVAIPAETISPTLDTSVSVVDQSQENEGSTVATVKSSSTQLSVGALTETDGNSKQAEGLQKTDQQKGPITPASPETGSSKPSTSTFADKAKTAMSKPSGSGGTPQSATKVLIPPSASVLRPTLSSKSKVKPVPRSNIASRFRTAVNSQRPSTAQPGVTHPMPLSQQIRQDNSSSANSASSKSALNTQAATSAASPKLYAKNVINATGRNSPSSAAPRAGVSRSKSMINPVALSRMKSKAGSIGNVLPGKKMSNANSVVSQSFMSLPDESREKGKMIDEDGWETVRNRSSRSSKRSPSNSSLQSITLSRNSIDKGSSVDKCCTGEEGAIKEDPMSSSVDDEEIKKKEAALDSAVREEELLEQELLQIEKDFEEIENRGSQSDTVSETTETSETENIASSPEVCLEEVENENKASKSDAGTTLRKLANPMSEQNITPLTVVCDDLFSPIESKEEISRAEELAPREPGRIVTLRQKLMSPAKRFDGAETLRRYQAKLEKAERNREKLLQAKYNRYVELSDKFESLNETTKRLMEERAVLIQRAEVRRKRAEEKREEYLKGIKRKAHDEDSKAREIAFINSIEAQNKRHDYFVSAQGIEERLQGREEERKQKLEERGVKLSAVIERQLRIRSNWEIKLKIMEDKRRQSDARITREKQEKAKERTELALEKARDREERLSALNAAKEAEKESLQKRIQQRQEDTARRHEENMEQIRQKAVELSGPRVTEDNAVPPPIVRMCTLCNVTMHSEIQELAHVRAKSHLEAVRNSEKLSNTSGSPPENFGFKFITDIQLDKVKPGVPHDKGRLKVMRKHCKKLLQSLTISGQDYEEKLKPAETKSKEPASKIQKTFREIGRLVDMFSSGKGSLHLAHALDRLLVDCKKQAVTSHPTQNSLISLGAFSAVEKVLKCTAPDLPPKVIVSACNFFVGGIFQNLPNSIYVLKSSCICTILELIAARWNVLIPDDNRWLCGSPGGSNDQLPVDPVIESVVELLFNILNVVPDPLTGISSAKGKYLTDLEKKEVENRTLDITGYLVASGVIDRFTVYCSGVRGPADSQPQVAILLQTILDFLIMLIYALKTCWDRNKTEKTMLLAALESSELAGSLAMSYALLFHQGAPTRPRQAQDKTELGDGDGEMSSSTSSNSPAAVPPPPGPLTVTVVKCVLCLINAVALLDIHLLQNILGSEAVSLQFRHIASQLLWQVVPHRTKDTNLGRLLKELLIAIGNFTISNKLNQTTIQSGQTPTVLQQLCALSYEYSSDPKLSSFYLPTLIAASYGNEENEAILAQHEIKREELEGFMHTEFAKVNALTKRLLQHDGTFTYSSPETTVISQEALKILSGNGNGGKKVRNLKQKNKKADPSLSIE